MIGRIDTTDKWDMEDLAEIQPEQWQIDALNSSADYCGWGPGQDYMWTKKGEKHWNSSLEFATWSEFGPWVLDVYNELVYFYFSADRPRKGNFIIGPAFLSLTLWILHPRKGCSRGVEIKKIEKHEMESVYAFLRSGAERNAERFSKLPTMVPTAKGATEDETG